MPTTCYFQVLIHILKFCCCGSRFFLSVGIYSFLSPESEQSLVWIDTYAFPVVYFCHMSPFSPFVSLAVRVYSRDSKWVQSSVTSLAVTKCPLPEGILVRTFRGRLGFTGKPAKVDFWNEISQYYMACILFLFDCNLWLTVTDQTQSVCHLPFQSYSHHSCSGSCYFSLDYKNTLKCFMGLQNSCLWSIPYVFCS